MVKISRFATGLFLVCSLMFVVSLFTKETLSDILFYLGFIGATIACALELTWHYISGRPLKPENLDDGKYGAMRLGNTRYFLVWRMGAGGYDDKRIVYDEYRSFSDPYCLPAEALEHNIFSVTIKTEKAERVFTSSWRAKPEDRTITEVVYTRRK